MHQTHFCKKGAKYSVVGKTYKDFIFYIQCKHHNKDLTKSAISEVYAGMHARGGDIRI